MRKLLTLKLLVFFSLLASTASASQLDTLDIPVNLDSAYAHYAENAQSALFEGYTIQLFSGTREGAYEIRAKILSLGGSDEARMIYREPNFKIHVGTHPAASMAERELMRWLQEFPNAFVVQTLVPLPHQSHRTVRL